VLGNLPVPAFEPAPLNIRWMWYIGPPALLTWTYRRISPRARGWWNPAKTPNSHKALAAILSGGGWAAFERFAFPQMKDGIPWWMDG
jgi:hypothetical protein